MSSVMCVSRRTTQADTAAICEAVTRPSLRFVGVRSLDNRAMMMRHKTREMLVLSEPNC
jgi:transposase